MRFVSNPLIEGLEGRRLFSASGHHHDPVDVDPPNHDAHDTPAITEPVHHHRRKGHAATTMATTTTVTTNARRHDTADDDGANHEANDGANHEANDAPGTEPVHHQRGKDQGNNNGGHHDAVDND